MTLRAKGPAGVLAARARHFRNGDLVLTRQIDKRRARFETSNGEGQTKVELDETMAMSGTTRAQWTLLATPVNLRVGKSSERAWAGSRGVMIPCSLESSMEPRQPMPRSHAQW